MKTLPGFRTLLALVLLGAFACVSYGQPVLLINYTNQIWRYNDTSTTAANPEGLFQGTSFNDSVAGWKTGHGLFGNDGSGVYDYAGSPFSGPNFGFSFPLDRSGGRVTFYFRTHFTYSGGTAGVTLYSTNYLDDGAAYYINGVEAGRLRVPAAPTALTWDTLGENPPTEGIPYFLQLNPAGLVVGDNVLAVEVHQSSATSSDVAFAMKLVAIQPFAPVILDSTQPSNRVVLAHRVTTLSVRADASPPISYQWYHDNVLIADATNANYTIPDMGPSDAGAYFARVSNPVGSVDSRVATVTYTEDSTAPQVLRAVGGANFDKIFVYFDEVVEENSSQDGFAYQVSDEVGTPYAILSAVRNPDGASVTVTLDPSAGVIPENTLVTVNISAVMDLANNTMVETNVTFRSNVRGCGGLVFEAFRPLSTTDNNLNTTLLANPDYPNFAQERLIMRAFDTRTVYPDDSHEGYGGRVRGIFIPRASGNWVFYLGSDDSSRLWLNPSGPGSEGKVLLTQETGCCTDWTAHQSAPVPLIAGNPYYIEGIYKEGTGGDYLKVSARLESEGRPPDNPNGQQPISAYAIPGDMLGYPSAPAGILAGTTISSQPATTTVVAGTPAVFSVQLSPDVPGCFQWKRDGVDIPGATGQYYRFNTALADEGAKFSVVVNLMGGTTLTSTEATLHVFNDTTGPTALSAATDAYRTNVVVTFNEAVEAASGGNTANYTIAGTTVQAATVSGSTVRLSLSTPLPQCTPYSVRIQNVKDVYNNTLVPNPTTLGFSAPLLLLPIDATQIWRYNEAGEELGDAWYATGYDDSTWPSGPATLAFPAGEVIQAEYPVRTPMAGPVRQTTYFRTHFNLPTGPSTVTNLQLQVVLDDGGVFYLNGQELTRIRMPAGPVTTNTLTTAGSPSDPPQILETYTVPSTALRSGDNVLAVRVHQSSTTSSDTVLAAGLIAQVSECRQDIVLTITRNGNSVTVTSTGGTIYRATNINGPWTSAGPGPINAVASQPQEYFQVRP